MAPLISNRCFAERTRYKNNGNDGHFHDQIELTALCNKPFLYTDLQRWNTLLEEVL